MKHTTAAIAIASLSASAATASSGSAASKSAKSGVGGVCTADDFTGGWKGGVFCGSVASVTDDAAVNNLFNGCNPMPRSYAETNNTVLELGNAWEMAVALEALEGEFASTSTATVLLHLFSFTTIIHTCRIAHHSFLKLYSRRACRWYFEISP